MLVVRFGKCRVFRYSRRVYVDKDVVQGSDVVNCRFPSVCYSLAANHFRCGCGYFNGHVLRYALYRFWKVSEWLVVLYFRNSVLEKALMSLVYMRVWLCRDINPSIGAVTQTRCCVIGAIVIFSKRKASRSILRVRTVWVVSVVIYKTCPWFCANIGSGRESIGKINYFVCRIALIICWWTMCRQEFWAVSLKRHRNNMWKLLLVSESIS